MPRKSVMSYETEGDTFAKQLKETMEERGESQTSLAAKITNMGLPIQRQTISLYMNGQSKPDTDRLTMLAKALNVSADWLLGLSPTPSCDESIKAACKATGLSAPIIEFFVNSSKQDHTTEFDRAKLFCKFFSPSGLDCLLRSIWFYMLHKIHITDIEGPIYQAYEDAIKHPEKQPDKKQINKLTEHFYEIFKGVRYTRFEAIDTFTELFDNVLKVKESNEKFDLLTELLYKIDCSKEA